jgi:hypothetical protein
MPLQPAAFVLLLLALSQLPASAADPVVAAVGDIACDPADPGFNGGAGTATRCRQGATSDLLVGRGLDAVLVLGDIQYEDATLAKFMASYDPTWGRLKAITRPAVGNHEYLTPGAAGYYSYFGTAAGDPAKGYYSFDLGAWHVVVLNSNCAAVGGCHAGSPQEQWLAADLAAHPDRCTLAYWHHPRFSSGPHGNDASTDAFWRALYAAGADVILTGHDHVYERFAPQDPDGAVDPGRGIRQFVVGTGGKNLTSFPVVRANSEVRNADTFGVLEMTLRPSGYEWKFLPAAGGTFTDSGTAACHSAPPPPATRFFTVPPCRVADTRGVEGPSGRPRLVPNATRTFPVAGLCGIPAEAKAVALNVTAVLASGTGHLRLYPAGIAAPSASTLNFSSSQARANNAIIPLGESGQIDVRCDMPGATSGGPHMILDVVGYFQ